MELSSQRKAAVLAEALPWLKEFRGATVVVKFGGNAMGDAALMRAFAEDIVFMRLAGLKPIVVHGGGPQINAMLETLGIESTFTGGLRVTTRETMDVVRMVLTGQVQREIVAAINAHGPFAVGLSGEDAHVFVAEQTHATVDGERVDIGFVGDVVDVNAEFLQTLLASDLIPVVSTVATGVDGESYNINADTAAAALAVAVGARKLVMLTDVEGVYRDWPNSTEVISELRASEIRTMLPSLAAGMIPKLQGCLRAVEGGVDEAHVIDGRLEHSVLLEVFTDTGIGTMIVPDP
jgi:acetylglutamate kinase